MGFFIFQNVALIIEWQYIHDDTFYLFTLLWTEAVVTILIGTCQCVNQFSGVEIIADNLLVRFYGQQATYVLYHFFCVYIQLQHLIGSIQIITFDRHTGDLSVWFGVVGIVWTECIARVGNHVLELRMWTYFPARFLQIVVQETIDAGICLRNVTQKNIGFGCDESGYVFGYGKTVCLAPGKLFSFFAYRTHTPVPCTVFQYFVRIEQAPGLGLGQYGACVREVFAPRETEL